ncbi:PstS family phosphate ABC transporter substrate-binding protein [Rubinisphaera margarita]|uniref:PstS family phosphate ABC transporter substrate-binding protein n=1 Tax=Rubinisphaera margarita TaxID=2909586 RepID=UPI001EE78BF8|nr:PstS family phosphate ABC transporter substrate-binding protein [Rubinisphaera margarita]MCG6155655.1 PstS family phosphate ABC transporter substrate-binding protein [Rubinisphaera margarita]
MTLSVKLSRIALALAAVGLLAGCEYKAPDAGAPGEGTSTRSSSGGDYVVQIAGSSTVYPVSARVAESADDMLGIKATVESTGTGTGFERLAKKECDITGASRPIKDSEKETCAANGVEPLELKVGMDGLSVVVNPENDWCKALTVAQLKKLWEHGSEIQTWKQLDPSWPDERIRLFGPDDKSGTFDYFNEEIIGEVPEGQSPCRDDYTPAVQDTVLVEGVKGDKYALGYFGYAYYVMNKGSLKLVGISPTDDKADAVLPNEQTIEDGSYKPLSRPLFVYVSKDALKTKPEVTRLANFYLKEGQEAVSKVGYVRLPQATIDAGIEKISEVVGQ